MAAIKRTEAGETAQLVAEPKEATLLDMIASAKNAETVAAKYEFQQKEAAQHLVNAKNEARAAWDALYAELLKLREENKNSEAYRNSKLGQLLQNARG